MLISSISLTRTRCFSALCWLLIALLAASCSNGSAEKKKQIPKDFQIIASAYSSTTDIKQTVYITAKGYARLETTEGGQVTTKDLPRLKRKALDQIIAAIERVKFFDLHSSYQPETITDGQIFSLEITLNGETNEVEVESLRQTIREGTGAQRFAKVWLAVAEATSEEETQHSAQDEE